MQNAKIKNNCPVQGFTLIEMMVSIAIFLLAMGAAMQLFFFSERAYRDLLAYSQTIGEMSYDLEHISRGLRMAKKSGDSSCLSVPGKNFESTGSDIKFQNLNGSGQMDCVKYYLGHPSGYPADKTALMEYRKNLDAEYALPLTSPEVNVRAFSIIQDSSFDGWEQTDRLQPRVTLHMRAQSSNGKILETQMTVSQRDIDVVEAPD
jgi:prepilin-type N-terminal cleavage/methylation domain-containing protein